MELNTNSLQDVFINQLIHKNTYSVIFLTNGIRIEGLIKDIDKYNLVVERSNNKQLIYKHSIATVSPWIDNVHNSKSNEKMSSLYKK